MNNREILETFWATMATNDFYAVAKLLHDDYILEWPQSAERIHGRDNFAAVNTAYPTEGRWTFQINHLVTEGDLVVTDVSVSNGKLHDRCITFSTVRDGRIWRQIEFWPASFDAPAWRAQWVKKAG